MTNIEALQEYDKLHYWIQNEAERIFNEWNPAHGYDYLNFHDWNTHSGICFKASWRGDNEYQWAYLPLIQLLKGARDYEHYSEE